MPFQSHNPGRPSDWTEEQSALVLKLDAENRLSRLQIAHEIERQTGCIFSRNAIIGKLRRLGAPMRQVGIWPRASAPKIPRIVEPKPPRNRPRKPKQPKPTTIALLDSLMLSFNDLTPITCRYPTSPEGLPIQFCGHEIDRGSYCAAHYKICYHASSPVNRMTNIRRHKEELLKKVLKPACEAA